MKPSTISSAAFASGVAAAALLSFPGIASAQTMPPDLPVIQGEILDSLHLLVATEEASLSDEDLGTLRGGQSLTVSNQTLTAISSGSVLNGDYTAGAISIADEALSNFNGIGNVMINTGALNNLQSGMNVTINIVN